VAPIVTLFYRKGIWLTPDDPVSPFGCGTTPGASVEPAMQAKYRISTFLGDWWWLGIRNSAYGLAYKFKPAYFKSLSTYAGCPIGLKQVGPLRIIDIFGYKEIMLSCGFFHILVGYRLRPIVDEAARNVPCRPINMDARPIFSIRAGNKDD
jgi:hypothetical protein